MLNESVIKLLKNGMWDLATCVNGEPNVVPVAFKDVTEDARCVLNGISPIAKGDLKWRDVLLVTGTVNSNDLSRDLLINLIVTSKIITFKL